MRSLCYENQFSFILKLELITITKVSHLDSLLRRDLGELGNGLFSTSKYPLKGFFQQLSGEIVFLGLNGQSVCWSHI